MPHSRGRVSSWTERNVPSGYGVTDTAEMCVSFSPGLFLSLKPDPSERLKSTHTLARIGSFGFSGVKARSDLQTKTHRCVCVCVCDRNPACQGARGAPTQPSIGHLGSPIWEKALVNIWNEVCGRWI